MKHLLIIWTTFLLLSCEDKEKPMQHDNIYFEMADYSPQDTLFRVSRVPYELGEEFAYLNQKGDTIIPFGKFTHSFSDTIITYGIVVEKNAGQSDLIGINQKGQRLFEVYWFDNGPDYVSDGLFRVLREGKIGYADTTGKMVIQPQFACATPFSDGQAKVTFDCKLVNDKNDEHTRMESDTWFFIDKNGQKLTTKPIQ